MNNRFNSSAKNHAWPSRALSCTALAIAVALAHTGSAADQPNSSDFTQLSLEQLMRIEVPSVTGASKFEQKETDAPASVSIVNADDIKKFGYRTLADVLGSMRGLFVTYDRTYSFLGVRGFNRPGDFGGRVLLLIDGHRVNENIFDSALIGNEGVLDVDLIDHVEFIRGPSSSLYGNNAFFGVINVVTKSGRDFKNGEASIAAGSFDTYKGRFTLGRKLSNGFEYLLSGSFLDSEGHDSLFFKEFDRPETNHGIARNRDGDRLADFFLKLSYNDFTLEGVYSAREKETPTAFAGAVFNDPNAYQTDKEAYVDLKYQHQFFGAWNLEAQLSYNWYWYDGLFPFDNVVPDDPERVVVNHDHDLGEWFAANVQVTRKLWDKHTLTAGFEYRGNIEQNQVNFDESPRAVYFDDMRSSQNFGFFGQGEFQLLSNLLLNAGIRYDNYYSFGTTTNPRLALIYHPWKKTTFKLLYGTAFRAPNAFEAYYAGFGSEPNTQLRPETIQTYEVVFEQELPYNLRFTTAAYYNRIKNLISQDLDPRNDLLIYQNEDRVDAHGIEAEIEAHYKNGIRARASYALQRTVDQVTGEELTNSPRHLGKFTLSLPLFDEKLCTGLELQYASSVKTLAGNRAHSFVVTNITLLTKKLFKNFELSASVYNVFDQRYGNPGGDQLTHDIIEQDGRTFRVKANYSF